MSEEALRGLWGRRALGALPYLAAVVAFALIGPWGEFPLNDDFTFARVARRFAETGQLRVDLPSAPSLVGQTLMVAPLVRAFGFSHLLLRLFTMALGLVGLWALGRLLAKAGVGPRLGALAQLLIALNPLYLYLSTTFMTELYGHVPVLLVAVLYLHWRERAERSAKGPLLSPWQGVVIALLGAFTFWTRQYCALVFPALLGSTVLRLALEREWRRLARAIPTLAGSCAVFVAGVVGYFYWAKATGNFRPEFRGPLALLFTLDLPALALGATNFLAYMTAFFLPMLLLFRWPRVRARSLAALSLGLVAAGFAGWWALQSMATSDLDAPGPLHRVFPFAGNILYNAGIGPVTLSDVYLFGLERPQWSLEIWKVIGLAILVLGAGWAPVALQLPKAWRASRSDVRGEVLLFAVLFGAASLLVTVQASKLAVFDRYYLPSLLALALVAARALEEEGAMPPALTGLRPLRFALGLAPIAFFSIAGLHDQFRWNEARWELVAHARADGAQPTNIDGGYEVNGWLSLDDYLAQRLPERCVGECLCPRGWWCLDASWQVGMNRLAGYQTVASIQPRYWLTEGPPVRLQRRTPAGVVRRSLGAGHWASAGPAPSGYLREASYRVSQEREPEDRPLVECRRSRADGTEQAVLSTDPTCEGGTVVGYLSGQPGAGGLGLYSCRVAASDDVFLSQDPSCEGQERQQLLGFALP